MSIAPKSFQPVILRNDHNQTTSQLVNKLQSVEQADQSKQEGEKKLCMKAFWDKAHLIVENINFQIFITVFTVTSLFMEDIRIIFLDISSDAVVDVVNIVFIVIFMVEILLSLSIPNYFCSFFFFLDIISTLSIVMDISMLTNYFSQSGTLGSGVQLSTIIRNSKASRAAARTVRVMKIFRLARIVKLYKSATKAKQLKSKRIKQQIQQRIQKMKQNKKKQVQKQQEILISYRNIQSQKEGSRIQAIQNKIGKPIIRQSTNKIYNIEQKFNNKQANQQRLGTQISQPIKQGVQESSDTKNIQQLQEQVSKNQSKISKLLSDSTMKKIILVILLIMFSVPALDIDNYYQPVNAWDFLANFVGIALKKSQIPIQKINLLISHNLHDEFNLSDSSQSLILFKTPFKQLYSYNSSTFSQQRINDLLISQLDLDIDQIISARNGTLTISQQIQNQTQNKITVIFSCKIFNQIDSWFSIGKIMLICIGIIYLLHVFNESISQMITEPIQKMLQDVKNNGKQDYIQQAQNNIDNSKKQLAEVNNYQTTNIHYALNKISHLISKFFGIRGKQFIYRRIFQSGTINANYLSQNKKVYCILALCNIDNYCHISKILKEDVIQLNNQVAQYLHSAAFRYGGTGLVNHQGRFLVVFQCPTEYDNLLKDKERKTKVKKFKQLKNYNNKIQKSIRNINKILKPRYRRGSQFILGENDEKSVKIAKMQNNYLNILADFSIFSMVKTLVKVHKQAKFYKYKKDARLVTQLGENFQININSILHAGWIHQGFIGSNLKMSFSYFGQIIQQVQKLAYHSRHIVGKILLSNNVYDLITSGMKRYTRIVDRYIDSKTNLQQSLYIVDLNLQNISPPKNIFDKKHRDPAVISLKKILNFQIFKDEDQIKNYNSETFINSKKQLRQVLKNVIGEQFRRKYMLAFEHYTFGQISQCKQILDELSTFNKDDFLVQMLSSMIESMNKKESKLKNNLEDIFQFL